MPKEETAFWMVLAAGLGSAFVGALLGIIFYPTCVQMLGQKGVYLAFIGGLSAATIIFLVLRRGIGRLMIVFIVTTFISCSERGTLYINGDKTAIGAEVYVDGVMVDTLTEVATTEVHHAIGANPSLSSSKDVQYDAEAVLNVKNGRHLIRVITAAKKKVLRSIEIKGSNYIYISDMPSKDISATRISDIKKIAPSSELKEAIAANDLCFKVANDYSKDVPGIELYYDNLPVEKCIKVMEGTSDALADEEDRIFQDLASEYATAYNKLLLEHIESRMPEQQRNAWYKVKAELSGSRSKPRQL